MSTVGVIDISWLSTSGHVVTMSSLVAITCGLAVITCGLVVITRGPVVVEAIPGSNPSSWSGYCLWDYPNPCVEPA